MLGEPKEPKATLREQFERAEPGAWIDVRPGYQIQRLIDFTEVSFTDSLNDPTVGHEVPLSVSGGARARAVPLAA